MGVRMIDNTVGLVFLEPYVPYVVLACIVFLVYYVLDKARAEHGFGA